MSHEITTQKNGRHLAKPYYDVTADKHGYHVEVHIPGVNKKDVQLEVKDNVLTLMASRIRRVPESWRPLSRELSHMDYRLKLQLNAHIDDGKVSAKTEDGVVHITLPLAEQAKPRTIPID